MKLGVNASSWNTSSCGLCGAQYTGAHTCEPHARCCAACKERASAAEGRQGGCAACRQSGVCNCVRPNYTLPLPIISSAA